MADNLWQTNKPEKRIEKDIVSSSLRGGDADKNRKEDVFPSVPPPPPEVKIRTMESDLEQMVKSGGGLPKFEMVNAPRLGAVMRGEEEKPKKKLDPFWVIVPILAAVLFGGIVYFAYNSFSGKKEPETAVPAPYVPSGPSAPTGSQAPSRPQAPMAEPKFTHRSLFRKPADEVLAFTRRSSAESAAELETFSQRLLRVLSGAGPNSRFLEIRFQDEAGRDLAIDEALALPDAAVLQPEFLLGKFNPDPTAFVYLERNIPRLGYVFSLKPKENWLFLRGDVAKLEFSPKIENFFLRSPGAPSGGFEDATINDQPARKLVFSSGAVFVYGWFRGNLILSASEEGFREALSRL